MLLVLLATSTLAAAAPSWPTQEPFWPHYPGRSVQVLNGTWSFGLLPIDAFDPLTVPYSTLTNLTPNTTQVPMSWDAALPGSSELDATNIALFRTSVGCTTGKVSLMKFYAVNNYARVFVDGKQVADHRNGPYTPFEFAAPACGSSGEYDVLVVTRNGYNSTLSPTWTGGDFHCFSGIVREVVVLELPSAMFWVDRVDTFTASVDAGTVNVTVHLNGSSIPSTVHLSLSFNGASGTMKEYGVVDGVVQVGVLSVPDFKPWRLGEGNLFTLRVDVHETGDAVEVRSGLREIGVEGGRLTLNGEVVKLHGVNRHAMTTDRGAAVTAEQQRQDAAILVESNVNAVRAGHYPQSQRWLDLMDEHGIVFWEEALGPGTSLKDYTNPYFMEHQLAAVRAMVTTSINHPSIILHGFFNEGQSNSNDSCPAYGACADQIHALAPLNWRMATWADDKTSSGVCYAHADVVSFNGYPAWYDHPGDIAYIAEFWTGKFNWSAANWPQKPLWISETGGSGIYEWSNNATDGRWTQKYQVEVISEDIRVALSHDRLSAITLWIGFDFIVTSECPCVWHQPIPPLDTPNNCTFVDVSCGRPKGENSKGVLADMWRRPKNLKPVVTQLYSNQTIQN